MTETIGGYELVRKLASSARSDVHLARLPERLRTGSASASPDARDQDTSAGGSTAQDGRGAVPGAVDAEVVLKLLRSTADGAGGSDELLALSATASEHVVRLLDVVTTDDGRSCLILEALQPDGVGELLRRRERLDPGEAVTLLISAARGLADLHAAGWVHGRVGAGNLLLRSDGTPVLVGFGAARHRDADGVAADRAAWARMVGALLPTLPVAVVDDLAAGEGGIEDAAERLFAVAEPIPVRVLGDRMASPRHRLEVGEVWSRIPGRGIPVQEPAIQQDDGPVASGGGWFGRGPKVRTASAAPSTTASRRRSSARVRARTEASKQPAAQVLLPRAASALRSIRPRFWLLGAGGAAALLVAVLAVPVESPASGAVVPPTPAASDGVLLPPAEAAIVAAIVGDDPAAAASALDARRSQCTADTATACIAEVDQTGSAQEAADRSALDSGTSLAGLGLEGEAQVQRLGDAALVTFGASSVLLVRTDLGWRIRDAFASAE
ncbi:protein kinase [Naasia lichenicola]|uniref:Protein kinase domain-containing protein n=1 Tax=Naasia lichenicola TaxID=2565933 RepID=A0A4S4FTN3_9MICO|nr:protein kinase [Naasia lichenicola]THG32946.1 hypothetical protein E6C64_00815 [Naasia lichenicola]